MMPADPLEQAHRMELERAICLAMIAKDPSPEAVRDGTALVIEYGDACRAEERASLASAPEASVLEEAVRAFEDAPMCEPCGTEYSHREMRPTVCHCTELGLLAASEVLTRPLAARVAELEAEQAVVNLTLNNALDPDCPENHSESNIEVARAIAAENARLKARVSEVEQEGHRRWKLVTELQGQVRELRKLLRRVEGVAWFAIKFFNGGRIEIGKRQLVAFEEGRSTLETHVVHEDERLIVTATGDLP